MEVKPGYKQTEVGVIPEDWEAKPIGSLADLYQPATISAHQFTDFGFPVYGANGVVGYFENFNHDRWQVTVTCRGSTCGTVNRTVDRSWITGNAMVVNCDRTNAVEKDFLYHLLCSLDLTVCITGTGQPQIVRSPLAEFLAPIPKARVEQKAIAEALSDADALIESLEQLIAKKRHLKQGAMQELLTGKRRLPGFQRGNGFKKTEAGTIPVDWIVKRVGEIARLYQPLTISAHQFTESGVPVYGANGVVGFFSKSNHETWQVTVTCRGSTCGTVNRTVDRCWITGNAMVLNCDQNTSISKEYFYHMMCGQNLADCITGTGQPQIVRSPLSAFIVPLPTTTDEQTAIASVLSDMDTEIEALESRLVKARQIKQGMMQELLTGRIRLV